MNSLSKKLGKDRSGKQLACFGWFVLLFVLLLNVSCGDGAPDWREALARETPSAKPIAPPDPVKTTNELIVYLDESGSMAGYVNREGQTVFGKALRELRFATGTFAGTDVRVLVRHVGSQIGPPLPDMDLTTASQDPSVYHAGETNLAGAISSFKVGYQNGLNKPGTGSNGDQSAVKDPPDPPPARFQVLVTDGVQSTKKGSTVQDCTAGSDQFCVRQKIAELLNAGWAGVVLGIRSDFHGKVYSEVSGAAIPFETRNNNLATFRPFYLYIFSPDARSLDALVRSLKDRLRPLVNNCADCIRELNLSFPYTDGFADFEITIPKESREALQKAKNQGGPPPRFTIHVDVDTERSAPKPFAIQVRMPWSSHALDAGDTQELVRLLSWEVRPVFPFSETKERVRFSDLKILRSHLEGDQIVLDATTAFQPGNERPAWRVYSVEAKVNFNQGSPGWIRDWSTDLDTKPEAANRTFNLETALLGLWNNSMAKEQVVARAYLRIGPN